MDTNMQRYNYTHAKFVYGYNYTETFSGSWTEIREAAEKLIQVSHYDYIYVFDMDTDEYLFTVVRE